MIQNPTSLKTHEIIIERVLESNREFDLTAARAELLKRNKKFLKELSYAAQSLIVYEEDEWQDFCSRWRISSRWNPKDLAGLEKKLLPFEIVCRRSSVQMEAAKRRGDLVLRQWINYPGIKDIFGAYDNRGQDWTELVQREDAFVYVRINPWTTLEEIEKYWLWIQQEKKDAYGLDFELTFKERERPKFFIHLCWYDLHFDNKRYGKISFGKIAKYWKVWGGKGAYSRSTISSAVERIGENVKLAASI